MEKDPNKNTANNEFENHSKKAESAKNKPLFDDIDDTDKYLAMEQPGITYTHENDPTINSDQTDFSSESRKRQWNDMGGNSKNSDAFNQDDYLLDDNIDLDEDQNQSISSDDDDFEETNERY
ncbi:MAG: hypothetical protein DI539_16225 [Flavobacterium psychrophilum]|nr:MAG: hypothetical protein DI539_16225 [Flavobacterium psychrophilum]